MELCAARGTFVISLHGASAGMLVSVQPGRQGLVVGGWSAGTRVWPRGSVLRDSWRLGQWRLGPGPPTHGPSTSQPSWMEPVLTSACPPGV